MPFKSKSLKTLDFLDPTWTQSVLGHLILVSLALAIYLAPRPSQKIQTIEMKVVEAPLAEPKPIQINQAQPKPEKSVMTPQKEVFGINRKSILQSEKSEPPGLEVKAGNTLAKAPDQEIADPNLGDLPQAVDEYLVDQMPKVLNEVKAIYTLEARARGIEGVAVFDLLIDKDGKVRRADLISGPGYGLNESVQEALMQFRFSPATLKSQPVAVKIRYSYRIKIER